MLDRRGGHPVHLAPESAQPESGPQEQPGAGDIIEGAAGIAAAAVNEAVAEEFQKAKKNAIKVTVGISGTGGGFKLFCGGVGVQHADVSNASRAIKASEFETCQKNGVTDIVEVKIGYDGIAVANSKKAPALKLTRKDLFMALAKEVPDAQGGKLIPNPYKTWKEVNPELPAVKIEVLGPPPTSGTRDAFLELGMEPGALKFESLKKLSKDDAKKFQKIFGSIREDGAYVEAGENDNLIVQKLVGNVNAFGIFGFANVDQNAEMPVCARPRISAWMSCVPS